MDMPDEIKDRIENGETGSADSDSSSDNPEDEGSSTDDSNTDNPEDEGSDDGDNEPSEPTAPSLFQQREENGAESRYASDEVYLIQDIGQEAGTLTETHAASHPLGIFRLSLFSTPLAQELKSKAISGHPQLLESKPSGKVQTPDGNTVGRLLDYNDNPLDPSRDNDGNIRLVTQGRNGLTLTSRSVSHGINIKGHFEDAYAEGDRSVLAEIIRYIKFAFREDVTVPDAIMNPAEPVSAEDLRFQAHSDKAKVLKRSLVSGGQEEEKSAPAVEGIGA